MNLIQAYQRERSPLFVRASDTGRMVECQERAGQAFRNAKIRLAWDAAGGTEIAEWEAERLEQPDCGRVRLLICNDDDWASALDFDGTEADHKREAERAERDGVCGVQAQFWDGADWEDVDSVWGFIGSDWRGSGHDIDLMSAALDALADHDAEAARELEASRPDLHTTH